MTTSHILQIRKWAQENGDDNDEEEEDNEAIDVHAGHWIPAVP